MTEIRIRFSRPRRQGTTEPAQPPTGTDVVVERDDGLFQIGLDDDAARPFPSRTFAVAAVAAQTRRGKTRCRRHNRQFRRAARRGSGKRPTQHQQTAPTHRRAPRVQ
jgi:hypothetical protein